ncbi:MAG: type II toxin-antitoxin system VapC family toxin [Luteolibacter sp.]
MPGFLIDTNVLSEIRKGEQRARPEVWQWWQDMRDQELFLSVMTLGEIRKGIDRIATRGAPQTLVLERWLEEVKSAFLDRLIEITPAVAECRGRLQAIRSLPEVDALLAASVLQHDLTLVTRNEADFEGLEIRVLNPFRADGSSSRRQE